MQGRVLAEIVSFFKWRRVACVFTSGSYGFGVMDYFQRRVSIICHWLDAYNEQISNAKKKKKKLIYCVPFILSRHLN